MTAHSLPTESRLYRSPLFWLILATLSIRGVVLFASLDSFNADPDQYMTLAENWREYGVFGYGVRATAFRPPLYPWTLKTACLLARRDGDGREENAFELEADGSCGTRARFVDDLLLSRNASVALFHWILGVATVALVYCFARTLGFSSIFAALGAALVAVDPILLQQSRLVMTETLAAFFAIAILNWGAFVLRRGTTVSARRRFVNYASFGASLGLATLCRPAYLAFAGLILLRLALVELTPLFSKSRAPVSFSRVAASLWTPCFFLLGLVLILLPWAVRNQRELGIFKATTTHGGYTLLLANNQELYDHYRTEPIWTFWDSNAFQARLATEYDAALVQAEIASDSKNAELFQDEWTREQALKTIRKEPRTFLYSCLVRVGELWRLRPYELGASGRSGTLALNGVAFFYALQILCVWGGLTVWFWGRNKRKEDCQTSVFSTPWVWGWLLVLSVQIPHLFYWTNMRMRAPLEVFLPLISLWGVSKIYNVLTHKNDYKDCESL